MIRVTILMIISFCGGSDSECITLHLNKFVTITEPKAVKTSTSARVIGVAASKSVGTVRVRTDAPAEMVTS